MEKCIGVITKSRKLFVDFVKERLGGDPEDKEKYHQIYSQYVARMKDCEMIYFLKDGYSVNEVGDILRYLQAEGVELKDPSV